MEQTLVCVRCGSPFMQENVGRPPIRCRPCRAIHKREKARERQAKWKANPENREHARLYMHEYHQGHKDDPEYRRMRREAFNRYKYGITQADLDARLEAQNHRCAICGGERNGPGTRLHIDHCHDTGRVRGLLCTKCNTMIGLADNDPERLMAAAMYLERAN